MGLTNDGESTLLIQSYPDLACEVLKMISSATREIYIAPRYYEPALGSRALEKYAEGVSFHMLDSNACGVAFKKRLSLASAHDNKNRGAILKLVDAPDGLVSVEKIDYSFIVVDGRYCCVELINPVNPDEFYCALKIESESLGEKLIGIFRSIAGSAKNSNLRSFDSSLPQPEIFGK
jgi:hypothetical protein